MHTSENGGVHPESMVNKDMEEGGVTVAIAKTIAHYISQCWKPGEDSLFPRDSSIVLSTLLTFTFTVYIPICEMVTLQYYFYTSTLLFTLYSYLYHTLVVTRSGTLPLDQQ